MAAATYSLYRKRATGRILFAWLEQQTVFTLRQLATVISRWTGYMTISATPHYAGTATGNQRYAAQ